MGRDRKESQGKGDIPIHIGDSLHCTYDCKAVLQHCTALYSIVKQLYSNKNNEQVI